MKKRILSAIMALALCMGLAVPAFAASAQLEGYAKNPQYKLTINYPDNCAITYKADTYQIKRVANFNWSVNADKPDEWRDWEYVYDDKLMTISPEQIPAGKMPLVPAGVEIIVSGLGSDDGVRITAYTDSDGNGVYNERLVINGTSVLPLKDSYFLPSDVKSVSSTIYADALGFQTQQDKLGYRSVTLPTDYLCEIFGFGTIFAIDIFSEKQPHTGVEGFVLLLTNEKAPVPAFTDVPSWCASSVTWAAQNGIAQGTGNSKFSPGKECTHEQILTFLYRAARDGGTASAEDMGKAVDWARDKGMIGASFDPKALCTRADAVTYIWQAFGKEDAPAGSFVDVPAGADYAAAVNWAAANGITNGYKVGDGSFEFRPKKTCNRGEIVTFLQRAYVPGVRLK